MDVAKEKLNDAAENSMMKAACHCGKVTLTTDTLPDTITSCNCSMCSRLGALWAYFTADQVTITQNSALISYLWGAKQRSYQTCSNCGCTTHYTQLREDGTLRIALNMRMADPDIYKSIQVRHFDGAGRFKYID